MDKRVGFDSTLLVSWPVIGVSFAASLIAWRVGADALAALLLTLSAVGLTARLWGQAAVKRMTLTVAPESRTLSVGQETRWHYTLENGKLLPLIWLELRQTPTACLAPDSAFACRTLPAEAPQTGETPVWQRRFAFLGGDSRLEWDCRFTAVRRGVYRPGPFALSSGDGFGLSQSTSAPDPLRGQAFAVWPRLVPVRTGPFLQNVWTGTTGRSGWAEDPGVLRGEREYLPGDRWKRIDWRMAARTDELYVREYETVQPRSFLFVLDCAGLTDPEETISLLASLLRALNGQGLPCGLALPRTAAGPAVLLRGEDPAASLERCMFALADFQVETARPDGFDLTALTAAAAGSGQVWLMGESAAALAAGRAARALKHAGARYLCRCPGGGALTFDQIRGKEAAS